MKKVICLMILGLLFSCQASDEEPNPNEMICKRVSSFINQVYRCENDEVVCYTVSSDGITCKFKS